MCAVTFVREVLLLMYFLPSVQLQPKRFNSRQVWWWRRVQQKSFGGTWGTEEGRLVKRLTVTVLSSVFCQRENQTVRPVNIVQLLNAEDDQGFTIDGKVITQVGFSLNGNFYCSSERRSSITFVATIRRRIGSIRFATKL